LRIIVNHRITLRYRLRNPRESRAEMPVRFVGSIRPHVLGHIGIGTGAAIKPRQQLGDRIADDLRIVILDPGAARNAGFFPRAPSRARSYLVANSGPRPSLCQR
jgi:hypothetical protein